MKKIMFHINDLSKGGAERVIVNLSNYFSRQGNEVLLVSTYSDKEYEIDAQIKYIILENKKKKYIITRNINRIFSLSKICKRERPDIVISFMPDANIRCILVSKWNKIPGIVSERAAPEYLAQSLIGKIAFCCYHFADGLVCQSKHAKDFFEKRHVRHTVVLPNILQDDFTDIPVGQSRTNRIVSVGRFSKGKNFQLLIETFALFHQEYPDWTLTIYGDGEERTNMEKFCKEYDLLSWIEMPGVVVDVPNAIKNAGMFVFTSNREGFPNALIEAMALGLPVITTDFMGGAASELIDNWENGIIVPREDKEALLEAMLEVAKKPELVEKLSVNAYKKAMDFYPQAVYEKWDGYISGFIKD